MSNHVTMPPRSDFDLPENVFEWLRSLTASANSEVEETDTQGLLNAKIGKLERAINSIEDDLYLSLVKAFKGGLVVNTFEYTGNFSGQLLDVVISPVDINHAECLVEFSYNGSTEFGVNFTVRSTFLSSTVVRVERLGVDASILFTLKVKEYKNG